MVHPSTASHLQSPALAAETPAITFVIPCRDFLQKVLPSFKEHNPQLDIAAQVKRGQHPHLTAEYGEISCLQLVSIVLSELRHRPP